MYNTMVMIIVTAVTRDNNVVVGQTAVCSATPNGRRTLSLGWQAVAPQRRQAVTGGGTRQWRSEVRPAAVKPAVSAVSAASLLSRRRNANCRWKHQPLMGTHRRGHGPPEKAACPSHAAPNRSASGAAAYAAWTLAPCIQPSLIGPLRVDAMQLPMCARIPHRQALRPGCNHDRVRLRSTARDGQGASAAHEALLLSRRGLPAQRARRGHQRARCTLSGAPAPSPSAHGEIRRRQP